MSKIALSGNASGTGTLTIAAPNTSTDRTLTLPDNTGTIVTSASSIAASQLPAGSVLQVVSTTKTDTFSTTAAAYTDVTGLSVSITPTSASNKILIFLSLSIAGENLSAGAVYRFVRDSTAIGIGDSAGSRGRSSGGMAYISDSNVYTTISGSFLDSPATTSATTYKVQVVCGNSGGNAYINRTQSDSDVTNPFSDRSTSTITVMEIAA